ncbi:DUF547 domain-containing protein [Flavobacteriaceae bacterium F89]|uniref:DUF547 domain-containing protein n=1 Tax=Cerina litoralis TaxID=2874477 RepID=A0AAE3EUZ2_9FLAO|nr:DUF547 domain-containing protein [Cerina litoralis]MCG2460774.1 DUF547 domain-containing protein [Cerina litoralis]
MMKVSIIAIIFCLLALGVFLNRPSAEISNGTETDFNRLSEQFLKNLEDGKDTEVLQNRLANTTVDSLASTLTTDTQKLAFWVNIYNAYIQVILTKNPELYKDRSSFFTRDQIIIAGQKISFATIEHGIIRKSQWDKGLGYVQNPFPGDFERKLRVDKRNYHIHFALNCGAKDCPPVAIYSAARLKEQFNKGTERYLKTTSNFDPKSNEVKVTSLFSWFRGDFGGESGIKEILKEYNIVPKTADPKLVYKDYDWTLDLHNFIDL